MSDSSNSTSTDATSKSEVQFRPTKPRDGFPLGQHPAGYWCKKIRGKIHYFGPHFDYGNNAAAHACAEAALEDYNRQAEALLAGRKPRPDAEALTVLDACNAFLTAKQFQLQAGELSPRTWQGYKAASDKVIAAFGKTRLVVDLDPDDFATLRDKQARKLGPHGLGT